MEFNPVKVDVVTQYCILCRYVISDARANVGCVLPIDGTLCRLHCLDAAWQNDGKNVPMLHGEKIQNQAYYSHSFCRGFVEFMGKDYATAERLLRFAQSSIRLFCLPIKPDSEPCSGSSETDVVPSSALSDEETRDLFRKIGQLPSPLQKVVIEYAGTCPIRSVLNIMYIGTLELLQRTVPRPPWSTKCLIARRMTFFFICIEGSWCWCGCETDKGIVGYLGVKAITVEIPLGANIVRFTIGCFGIRGLQFRGPIGVSELIGEFHESLWTGEITSRNPLQHLLLGLDIRNLNIKNRQKSFGSRFMWKSGIPLSTAVVINHKAYFQKKSWLNTQDEVNGFLRWRLIGHLPLWKPDRFMYGLTVYCASEGGITGLESHFRSGKITSSLSIGHQIGCAIFFNLADSEYFDSAWVLCDEVASLFGPFLMLRTSKNRIASFRPLLSDLVPKLLHMGRILGIYCNARPGLLRTFGTVGSCTILIKRYSSPASL
ncbi:hypothetical protein IQ07DRAFT_340976 [Pyrenochaeta sp. DS3sAY3a]|nr:hypothetical protein IQ07DRAFT_340976 [Pyrenochaeta sp. DS3sAY3a]